MPGFDGTGPMGLGPMTGGGRGYCVVPVGGWGPARPVYDYGVGAAYPPYYGWAPPVQAAPPVQPWYGWAPPVGYGWWRFGPRGWRGFGGWRGRGRGRRRFMW